MKNSILYVHNSPTTFVNIDREILQQEYVTTELYLREKRDMINLWKLISLVRQNEIIVGWFASWHTLIPFLLAKALRRKILLIAGGYDTAAIREANYGNQLKLIPRICTNYTIKLADIIICNSEFTKRETLRVSKVKSSKVFVVYHGLPKRDFEGYGIKKKQVLNVGNLSEENLIRKGIHPFLESARHCEDWEFIHAGKIKSAKAAKFVNKVLVDNTTIHGFIAREVLDRLYSESLYYIQPSLHEGFGMSVAEAMQFGCVPIVSNHGALPEVVGDCGLILESISPEEISAVIQTHNPERHKELSRKAQSRIKEEFTLERRRDKLLEVIERLHVN